MIRAAPGAPHVTDWHAHDEAYSLTYLLKGYLEVEFEQIGRQQFRAGDVIHAWNGPRHREIGCGDGMEALVIRTGRTLGPAQEPRVTIQRARDAEYEHGLRDYFIYRDFGLKDESAGAAVAHAIKVLPGKHPHGQWHTHDLAFQFVYVAAGWVEFDYEDIGPVRLQVGSAVYQPPMIRHAEVAHSDDVQIIEFVAAGEFATALTEAPARAMAAAK